MVTVASRATPADQSAVSEPCRSIVSQPSRTSRRPPIRRRNVSRDPPRAPQSRYRFSQPLPPPRDRRRARTSLPSDRGCGRGVGTGPEGRHAASPRGSRRCDAGREGARLRFLPRAGPSATETARWSEAGIHLSAMGRRTGRRSAVAGQSEHGCPAQEDRSRSGLAVGQPEHAIADLLPAELHQFAFPTSGKEEEAYDMMSACCWPDPRPRWASRAAYTLRTSSCDRKRVTLGLGLCLTPRAGFESR